MVVHTLVIRAGDIADLPEAEFTVIPIASIFLKLMGEVYACFATVIGVAGGILIWFADYDAGYFLRNLTPFVPHFGGEGFVGGILFMAGGVLVAFFVLAFFYLMAEAVVVLVDIARDVRIVRQIAQQFGESRGP